MKQRITLSIVLSACLMASSSLASNLPEGASIGGPLSQDVGLELSGAYYEKGYLWLVTNNDQQVWKTLVKKTNLKTSVEVIGHWSMPETGDFEAITAVTRHDEHANRLFVLDEGKPNPAIIEFEFPEGNEFDSAIPIRRWDLPKGYMKQPVWPSKNEGLGSEGLSWVPDGHYEDLPRTNKKGKSCLVKKCLDLPTRALDGLFLVAHQKKGHVYAFRLALSERVRTAFLYGRYKTARDESSGLEYDADSRLLLIWHGGKHNTLEVVNLSVVGEDGRLAPSRICSTGTLCPYPKAGINAGGDLNLEGVAISPIINDLFLTVDDEESANSVDNLLSVDFVIPPK